MKNVTRLLVDVVQTAIPSRQKKKKNENQKKKYYPKSSSCE